MEYNKEHADRTIKDIKELSTLLDRAIKSVDSLSDEHKLVLSDGSKYTKVVQRNKIFKSVFGLRGRILTEIVFFKDNQATIRADIYFNVAGSWEHYGSGHSSKIVDPHGEFQNLESIETAAIGRALASIGLSGDEYASDVELSNAVNKKSSQSGKNTSKGDSKQTKTKPSSVDDEKKIMKSSLKRLDKLLEESSDYDADNVKIIYGVKSLSDLTRGQYKDLDNRISGKDFVVLVSDIEGLIEGAGYSKDRLLSDYNLKKIDDIENLDNEKRLEIFKILKNRKELVGEPSKVDSKDCEVL